MSSWRVGVLGKRELKLVSERSARTQIIQGAGGILFAGLLEFGTLGSRKMRACI